MTAVSMIAIGVYTAIALSAMIKFWHDKQPNCNM